ncbi:integrase core domain-containing protein [Alkanindiges illinoisensis]|uniref:Integrase catalytic domain-containing protein n=1 Tax=Alkanindiges illinoisensis TaxID=197183 RepID=A0A4Y7XBT3_9GAMM|nr:hypothetical protein E2B99_08075 [Alkanindiges illinoisensis]
MQKRHSKLVILGSGPAGCSNSQRWRQHYNYVRPHSSLNYQSPFEYASKAA